jgi:acyl-CoA synthetase (AMP-forming)/AMP-acid ligase II/acyl carrier protein
MHALRRLFPFARLVIDYATTESGCAGTSLVWEPDTEGDAVGRPYDGGSVRVVDDRGAPSGPGEIGVVELGLPPGAPPRAYLDDPTLTRSTFRGRWVRTGDIGSIDAGGVLHLQGRRVEVIVCGGHKISCSKVERALESHPFVAEAAAYAVPDDVLGEVPAVAVIASGPVDLAELRRFARAHLPPNEHPRELHIVDVLPRTTSGKVRRTELAAAVGAALPAPPIPVADDVAAVVLASVQDTLDLSQVDMGDDLLDLGASSLDLLSLHVRLTDALGYEVELATILGSSTIGELVDVMRRGTAPRLAANSD